MANFYRGLPCKLIFNAAMIFNLRNLYENDCVMMALSFPLMAFSYSMLTIKTRLQLCNTPLSFQKYENPAKLIASIYLQRNTGLYRGLIPFLALNTFF
jgi:hypothetical protein